ncbi:hypothetical protein PILCRDRAFT_1526 [Piloderma croceum F 1598]|uniref:Protein kinase domain-containing protein n=1 Tax=Piloderma croceum (strain F 1598) TaxID=765440 RepID=A0A0C3GEP6_PILCF|nr:hypothetical protein PILCRDRAFT_1526 [Piloderma croceum F 1598]
MNTELSTEELWAMLEQGSKDCKLIVYRGPNMDARRDGDCLVPLPPVDGMPYLPVGVFPETLKDLKTLDAVTHNLWHGAWNWFDPRFISHRFQSKYPWDLAAEVQATQQRLHNTPFDFEFPSNNSFSNEIAAYSRLRPLQGGGVPKCLGSGTLNLPGRLISPNVLFLEYLKDAQSLRDVETKLIAELIVNALKETVSAFGRLGVANCDLNYGNIVFLVGCGGIYRAVIIDLGNSCVRDEEWDAIVEEQSDVHLEKRLARTFKERP